MRLWPGFWPGMPIALDTNGLVPISIQLSASWKSTSPPSQCPCAASAICLPGWSIVLAVKNIGDSIARMKAFAINADAG